MVETTFADAVDIAPLSRIPHHKKQKSTNCTQRGDKASKSSGGFTDRNDCTEVTTAKGRLYSQTLDVVITNTVSELLDPWLPVGVKLGNERYAIFPFSPLSPGDLIRGEGR